MMRETFMSVTEEEISILVIKGCGEIESIKNCVVGGQILVEKG
jgi:hypothetical protein